MSFAQLAEAIDTDLVYATTHTRLLVRSAEWAVAARDHSRLLRGSDLRAAEAWLGESGDHERPKPTSAQREYISASRRAVDRTARRQRGALAIGLAVAITLATVAFLQRNQATREATEARARALAAEATADLPVDPTRSLQLALASARLSPSDSGDRALRLALAADHMRMSFQPGFGPGTQAVWSPTEEIIAATGRGNTVQLWRPRTGRLLRTLGPLPAKYPITQLIYNTQGTLLAAIARNGLVAVWDTTTGKPVAVTRLNDDIRASIVRVNASQFGPPGAGLAGAWDSAGADLFLFGIRIRGILVFHPLSGRTERVSTSGPVTEMAFAPPGTTRDRALVLTSTDGFDAQAAIVEFMTGTAVAVSKPGSATALTEPHGKIYWTAFHKACWTPDGSMVATWNPIEVQDPTMRVFSAQTGAELFERTDATFSAAACGETAKLGSYVAAGDYNGGAAMVQVRAQQTKSGTGPGREFTFVRLNGHSQIINSVAVSDHGDFIATGSDDGTVRVWAAVSGRQLTQIPAGAAVDQVSFSAGGGALLMVTKDGTVHVADSGVGLPAVPLERPAQGATYALGFADGGSLVYGINQATRPGPAGGESLTVLLWHAASGMLAASYRLPERPAIATRSCANSSDAPRVCAIGPSAQESAGVTVSGDGTHLAYAAGDAVIVTGFGGRTQRLALPGSVTGLAFGGAGDREIIVMAGTTVSIWQPLTSGHVIRIPQPAEPRDAELSADGSRLATASSRGATVWDTRTGRVLGRFSPRQVRSQLPIRTQPERVALNRHGGLLAIGTTTGSVELWQVAPHRRVTSQVMTNAVIDINFPVAELSFAASGSAVLAANFPYIGTSDSTPPGSALVLSTAGRQLAALTSPSQVNPPLNPGAVLSPDGEFILGGIEGFAPGTSVPGDDAVYLLDGSQQMLNLTGTTTAAPPVSTETLTPNLVPVSAWAPDGERLLTGAPAVYDCDACGSPARLQSIAASRLAWAIPLTPAREHPPDGNAFS